MSANGQNSPKSCTSTQRKKRSRFSSSFVATLKRAVQTMLSGTEWSQSSFRQVLSRRGVNTSPSTRHSLPLSRFFKVSPMLRFALTSCLLI